MNKSSICVVMPSYLNVYDGSAKDRVNKFKRAVESFIKQDYTFKHLIIISDGCEITNEIYLKEYIKYINISLIKIEKQSMFSGVVRQYGLKNCLSDYVCYLDTDDYFDKPNHLGVIVNEFDSDKSVDWVYYNDYIKYFHLNYMPLEERNVEVENGVIGTSSIAHRCKNDISWIDCNGYGHDFSFIQKLKNKYNNYKKIKGTSYVVCHIPNNLDN